MDDQEQKKLCWECGAEVDFTAEECPFCGAQFEVAQSDAPLSSDSLLPQQNDLSSGEVEDPYEPAYEASYNEGELPFGSQESSESTSSEESLADSNAPTEPDSSPAQNMYLDAGEEEDLLDLSFHEAPKERSLFSDPEAKGESQEDETPKKGNLFRLSLIIPGFSLLLFGLGMVFFSENGQLTLRWDASYGLFVFTLSALFIYLGARAFRKM